MFSWFRKKAIIVLIILVGGFSACSSDGRSKKDKNSYPDYNRLELHPKKDQPPQDAPAPSPTSQKAPPVSGAAAFQAPPIDPEDMDTPRPPPAVVPMDDEASEPPLPDDIKNTLVPGATSQK